MVVKYLHIHLILYTSPLTVERNIINNGLFSWFNNKWFIPLIMFLETISITMKVNFGQLTIYWQGCNGIKISLPSETMVISLHWDIYPANEDRTHILIIQL